MVTTVARVAAAFGSNFPPPVPLVTAEVVFGGRLGEYRYYTMAEAIAAAREKAAALAGTLGGSDQNPFPRSERIADFVIGT